MNVSEALMARKSTRAFLKKDVAVSTVKRILNFARQAPSGANTQPWQVAVVKGAMKQQLQTKMLQAYEQGITEEKDYQYYPVKWHSPYRERRVATGMLLYETMGIARNDLEKRKEQWLANYKAFDAPVVLYFFLDRHLAAGSILDYGMFLQSVMLVALEEGLATCPQAALAEYPSIIKSGLDYAADSILICGMALGYENKKAKINSYRTPRAETDSFTKYFD